MKYIAILFLVLLNQDYPFLVKQADIEVSMPQLDAYVYMLPESEKDTVLDNDLLLEKNIYSLLSLNLVYDYILKNNLENNPAFKPVKSLVDEVDVPTNNEFLKKVGVQENEMKTYIKDYLIRKEYYARMITYIEETLLKDKVDMIAKEKFAIQKSKWVVPEKRDLSVILLDVGEYSSSQAKEILLETISNDNIEKFEDLALKYSNDKTVKYNKGNLSEFRLRDLRWPFASEVFAQPAGVVPTIYKYENNYYIIRVNKIIDKTTPKFEDYKSQIVTSLIGELAQQQFQSIINMNSDSEIETNPEQLAKAFERYKVLIKE